jgi:hydrogenase small subunit
MPSVLWLQGGACTGNTMSFLGATSPSVTDLITGFGLDLIWHPALSPEVGDALRGRLDACVAGERPLDILVVEGAVILGPQGTGRFDRFAGRPLADWVAELAERAGAVVAVGSCAAFGGLAAAEPNPAEATGLQFHRRAPGGLLGADFRSGLGLPVVNIPGCPAHPDWITHVLVALATGRLADLRLDDLGRPQTFFTTFAHTGCTRNSFYEFRQATPSFGEGTRTGCLFYEFGCRGPMTHSPCNRILWNRHNSKTRAGLPCLGCTEPEFPWSDLAPGTVFTTRLIAGAIPRDLPEGADHVTDLALAAAARAAAPDWAKQDMFVV